MSLPPPPPPPGFPPPGYPQGPYRPTPPTNGLAVASLVLGILGLVTCWFTFFIAPVLATIFGAVARRQIRERGQSGNGMAVAGLVMGIIGIVISALYLLALIADFVTTPGPVGF